MEPQNLWALKEWASVCGALDRGDQTLLFRKGGIRDEKGTFRLEHPEFFLYPTREHQKPEHLQPRHREALASYFQGGDPATLEVKNYAVVDDVRLVQDPAPLQALSGHHVWTPENVEMRFRYKPQIPLYVLLVRAYRLPHPVQVEANPRYAGCKSWVDLDHPIPTRGARPVLDDKEFEEERRVLAKALS
ncbi:MAG: DUF1802 family protein [Euryarchaeota archaeon]|nr:DUF1802 family protein [Euryarchaeota archaeon]